MRLRDYLKTSAFSQSLTIVAFFTASSVILFGFVFWQTVSYASQEIDHEVAQTAHAIGNVAAFYIDRRLNRWLSEEIKVERYGLLLDRNGVKVAGNMELMPAGVVYDGEVRTFRTRGLDGHPEHENETVRGVALKLPDGRALLIAVDTDEWEDFRDAILRALALGLIPTVALGCLGGALFGRATLGRLSRMDAAIDRIVHGDLSERLPHSSRGRSDELDRLARRVNLMLDDLERLVADVQVVGDSIAHDLRTPLTRMRARLENGKTNARTPQALRELIDEALLWLDQTFGVISAVLRIGEIEHGRRRAGASAS